MGTVWDFRSRAPMGRLVPAFRALTDLPNQNTSMLRFDPGVAWSDHDSFWRHGYFAVMVTHTAFYRYRHYHASTDTPDKLSYPEFANVTLGLFSAFAVLASEGVNPSSPQKLNA